MDLARAPRRTARKKGSGYENGVEAARSCYCPVRLPTSYPGLPRLWLWSAIACLADGQPAALPPQRLCFRLLVVISICLRMSPINLPSRSLLTCLHACARPPLNSSPRATRTYVMRYKTWLEEMWEAISFTLHRKIHLLVNVANLNTSPIRSRFWQTLKSHKYSAFKIGNSSF
jgi:hypothetical protein